MINYSDHLWSSSWITFSDGRAVYYLPFGEDFVNKKSSSFEGARYTFSAKEKDAETKYSYFGARYYSSELSIWLSVDPMSDKYPSFSPYVYCANNPIKLVDPNGEEIASPDDPPKRNTSSNQQPSNSMLPYYKQEYEKADNITTKLNYGLKIVGEKLNFDEQNFVDAAGSFLQGAALFNPLVGITNDIKIVSSGTDIYGNQSNIADRFVSGLDAVSFGVAKSFKFVGTGTKMSNGFEKTLNISNLFTTGYSVRSTTKKQMSKLKEECGNGQKKQ